MPLNARRYPGPTKTRARDPLTSAPAPRPVTAFENPNATMKEITATLDRRRKPWRPTSRSTALESDHQPDECVD
jgi:hypothetical protein